MESTYHVFISDTRIERVTVLILRPIVCLPSTRLVAAITSATAIGLKICLTIDIMLCIIKYQTKNNNILRRS